MQKAVIPESPRILLVCATHHGSTTQVADAIADELRGAGADVDVQAAASAAGPEGFDAAVIGGPMIMGWHKDARRYVQRHGERLATIPTAIFITAASLTEDGKDQVQGVPIVKDPWLVKPPRAADKLGYRERYALPSHYLGDVLKAAPGVRPAAAAFFAGVLDLTTMNLLEKVFVLLIIGATPGDARNWKVIRGWARGLPAQLFDRHDGASEGGVAAG